MLDFLRKRRRSWVVMFFLVIIVLVFVLWGVGSNIKEPRSENIAEVNGEIISQREFELRYQKLVEFYRGLLKGALTQETLKGLNLKGAIVEELIQKRLLLQEARKLGMEVADQELMDAIARVPDFQVNGRFSQNRYLQALRSNRLTPAQFEGERREQLTIQKLYDILQDAVNITEGELRDRYSLEQARVNFYFMRLSAGDFMSQVQITADEIKEFYNVQRETRFHQPKGVRLRHILFRVAAGAEPKQKETIRLRAEAALHESRSS